MRYNCPNLHKGCQKGAFLYPRKKLSSGRFHYHQGVDIGNRTGQPIVAVIGGEVTKVHDSDDNDGYGRVVVVCGVHQNAPLYTLYSHCHEVFVKVGEKVAAQQIIATVGYSGNAGYDAPHLHFECSRSKLPKKKGDETVLGQREGPFPRIDPLRVLEELGPWESTDAYLPAGERLTDEGQVAYLHSLVENSPLGGYFPLGGNNTWHGGVHLPRRFNTPLVAPFDGEIVALRLDPDPTTSLGAFGHTNFILLRHELSADAFERLQWRPVIPPTPEDAADASEASQRDGKFAQVGYALAAAPTPSAAEDVAWVQRRLIRFREYELAKTGGTSSIPPVVVDSAFTPALREAIRAFQLRHVAYFKKHPKEAEGYVTPAGQTRVVLQKPCAELLDGKKKPAKGAPAPKPEPSSVGREATNEAEHVIKAKHLLHAANGGPFYTSAETLDDPTADEVLTAAIEAFQRTMGYPFKTKGKTWPDGIMTVGAKTWTALLAAQPAPESPGDTPADAPTTDEPAKLDPKRTLYSLYMHLAPRTLDAKTVDDFPWLRDVVLEPVGDELQDVEVQRAVKSEGDDEERARGLLADVGAPGTPSDPEDVRWVQRRLTRFDYYTGAIDGVWSAELQAAIATFQRAHVKYYDPGKKKPNEPPGYIKRGTVSKTGKIKNGDTHKRMREPYTDLFRATKPPVDPVFAVRVAARKGGTATVITRPGVTIAAGKPVWASGLVASRREDGTAELHEQVHWEMFSEHPLVEPWEALEDMDDDLTLDVPAKVFDRIEYDGPPGFARDQLLTPEEVREFYRSGRAEFFRNTQCRFRSEWGLDVAKVVARLQEQGFTTDGFAEQFRPYLWWDEAKAGADDAMPASKHVWHYNPIELLWRYEQVLATMRPQPAAEPKAPGSIRVQVTDANLVPLPQALVHLAHGADVLGSDWTDLEGVTQFAGIPPGDCVVWIDGTNTEAGLSLGAGMHQHVLLRSDLVGPGVQMGTLEITVLGPDASEVAGAEVRVVHGGGSVTTGTTDDAGVARFELSQGYYSAESDGAESVHLSVTGGARAEATLSFTAVGAVAVLLRGSDGVAMAGEDIALVEAGGSPWGRRETDADGGCMFEGVPEGDYDVLLDRDGAVTQGVVVARDAMTAVNLLVPLPAAPNVDAELGALEVLVVGPGQVPSSGDTVYLLDDMHERIDDGIADAGGRMSFEGLEPGVYGVSSDFAVSDRLGIAVDAGARTSVVLEVGARDAPVPTPDFGRGALAVAAWLVPSGAPCVGLWVKVAQDGEIVRSLMAGADGSVQFDDVDAGPCRVFVDGMEEHGVDCEVVADAVCPVLLAIPEAR